MFRTAKNFGLQETQGKTTNSENGTAGVPQKEKRDRGGRKREKERGGCSAL